VVKYASISIAAFPLSVSRYVSPREDVAFFSVRLDFKENFSVLSACLAVFKKEANSFSAFALLDVSNGYSYLKFCEITLEIVIDNPPKKFY
jgi:hypothetical protein